MNKKGFIIIFSRWYFIVLLIIVGFYLGYGYLNDKGKIEQGTTLYKVGSYLELQPPNASLIEQEIFRLTNQERQREGLKSLQWDERLGLIAQEHSADMQRRNFFEHVNPDGDGPTERAQKKGIKITNGNWIGIAENIGQTPRGDVVGCGQVHNEEEIAKCAVDGWMESSGHRANILNVNYDVLGVGTYCTDSECWNTQDFR